MTEVLVDTRAHRLTLCDRGEARESFRVRLGRNGTHKRREGDQRTPVGTYTLSPPRSSSRFHMFIPIDYPTPKQRHEGFTGSAVGIHATSRAFAWLGAITAYVDTTDGCIAVAHDREIESIATWVRTQQQPRIRIE